MGIKIEKVDKNRYKLLDDYSRCVYSRCIIVKRGFVTDGASIPKWLWWLVGSPFTGNYTNAAIIHDALYASEAVNKSFADTMFLKIMEMDGVGWFRRNAMYLAVDMFGHHVWDTHTADSVKEANNFVEVIA